MVLALMPADCLSERIIFQCIVLWSVLESSGSRKWEGQTVCQVESLFFRGKLPFQRCLIMVNLSGFDLDLSGDATDGGG